MVERATPLDSSNIEVGMWVRVKTDVEAVKTLCRGDGDSDEDYAVGWESGMDETIGKPFVVGVVSRAYRMSPVVGLSVPNGLVAIAGGRFRPTGGTSRSRRSSTCEDGAKVRAERFPFFPFGVDVSGGERETRRRRRLLGGMLRPVMTLDARRSTLDARAVRRPECHMGSPCGARIFS